MGLAAVAAILISGALIWGLYSRAEETDRRDRALQHREQADPGRPDDAPARLLRPAAQQPAADCTGCPGAGTSLARRSRPTNSQRAGPGAGIGRACRRCRAAARRTGNRSRAHQPPVRHDEREGTPGDADRFAANDTRRPSRRTTDRSRRAAAIRSGLAPEYAGPQARIPDGRRRSQDREPRSARQPGIALCRPGRRRDSGGAHHRHSLRSPGPGHRSGHRARLRQSRPANIFSSRKDRSSSASTTARSRSDRTASSSSGRG